MQTQSIGLDRRTIRVCLCAIAAAALVVRLAAVFYLGRFHTSWLEDWDLIARSLVQTGTYALDEVSLWGANPFHVTAFIPPVYPAFLALTTILFGSGSWLVVRLVQALASTLSVVLLYPLGKAVFGRQDVSLLATLVAALFPPLIGGVVQGNTGTFEVLFTELIVLLALEAARRRSLWGWVWPGALAGLAALTRAPALLLLPMVALSLWAASRQQRMDTVVRPLLVMGLAALLVIAPWTVRNYLALGEFIPISSNGGINFWIGNNEKATGEFIHPVTAGPDLVKASAAMTEGARDRFFYNESLSFIRENPRRFLELLGVKLLFFLWGRPSIGESYADQGTTGLGVLAYLWANRLLLPVWLAGAVLTLRHRRQALILDLAVLSVLVVNVLYFAGTRYQVPAAPFQILLASYAIVTVVSHLRHQTLRGAR